MKISKKELKTAYRKGMINLYKRKARLRRSSYSELSRDEDLLSILRYVRKNYLEIYSSGKEYSDLTSSQKNLIKYYFNLRETLKGV